MRIRVLIAIAALLAAGLAVKYIFFSGPPADEGQDPAMVKVDELARAKDVAGLASQIQTGNEHMAALAVSALGRMGEVVRPEIERAMTDKRPVVREKAVTAFSKIAPREEAAKLAVMVKQDESADVRAAAVAGLDRMYAFQEMEAIIDAMKDSDPAVRRRASKAATKFTCATVQYNPEGSPQEWEQGAERMRQVWQQDKARATAYWKDILTRYPQGVQGQ